MQVAKDITEKIRELGIKIAYVNSRRNCTRERSSRVSKAVVSLDILLAIDVYLLLIVFAEYNDRSKCCS